MKGKLLLLLINYALILIILPIIFIQNGLNNQNGFSYRIPYKFKVFWCKCYIMFLEIYLLDFWGKDWNITIQNYSERRNILLVQQWIISLFVDHVKAKFLKRFWIVYTHKYESTKNVKIKEELIFKLQKVVLLLFNC